MGKIVYGNTVFKSSDDYTDAEVLTDKVYFGKKVYRKCFKYTLNATVGQQLFNHNITNIDEFTTITGIWKSGSVFHPLPFVYTGSTNDQVYISATKSSVTIGPGTNRSGSVAVVILEYTCTDR